MPSEVIAELDVRGVSAAFEARVADSIPELRPLALRTLDRVGPRQWVLEWYLPWWLGHAFGLPADISRAIVLSNVLGLASLRLQDDLVDGDVEADEIASADHLGAVLYQQAIGTYRTLFDPMSPFWGRLESYMEQWRAATSEARPGHGHPLHADANDPEVDDALLERLARRGAPLKVSAVAVCLLADREDRFPTVDRCLDDALAAMVLYDHFIDWEADMAAGRWNAFSSGNGGDRASVVVAMLARGAIERQFARIHALTVRAASLAEELGSPPLAAHLRHYAARIDQQGALLQAHHGRLADRATTLILGSGAPRSTRTGGVPDEL